MLKMKAGFGLSCRDELAKLDQEYERARKRLVREKGKEKADPNLIVSTLSELSRLRREMLRLESAESERIAAKYQQAQRMPS